ncbi:MAG: class I SAM-dependent methyltransferase [Planctomycetota bacterium]
MRIKRPWRIGTRARLLLRGLRYRTLLPYASVDGWLTVDEAIELFERARSLPHERPVCVEIGSWQGKSSICLGKGLAYKAHPRLVCIDPFDASGDAASTAAYNGRAEGLAAPLRAAFEHNITSAGVRGLVDIRAGLSHDHAAAFQDPIDLLFLDGDHSYDAIRRDYLDWGPKVRRGGYLCLHDVVHQEHDGPRRVVEELVKADPSWTDHRYVDSMFVARRATS